MGKTTSPRAAVRAALFAVLAAASPAAAQHEQHTMPGMAAPGRPLGIPMERAGSGTSWIPEAAPFPGLHWSPGAWELMAHGMATLQYDHQGGPRGDAQLGSINWAMLMAARPLAGGRLEGRVMVSLDPATVGARGYPLLLQTGETFEGEPIHDRQHPHDFWMELAVLYERAVTPTLGVSLYAAPVGEPALGPVAYMHRPSAMDDPLATLAHHWQDASHVTFGVLTAGLFGTRWKLEGSLFNGREPDEERWGFDRIRLDSRSARLTVDPNPRWSFSAGYGRLDSPEGPHAHGPVDRTTAAVLYGRRWRETGRWAATLAWGANHHGGETTHGLVLESELVIDREHALFGRLELADKTGRELGLAPAAGLGEELFRVRAASLGFVRELGGWAGLTLGLGARGTVNLVPERLEPFYGSRTPLGALLYLRVRPVTMPPM